MSSNEVAKPRLNFAGNSVLKTLRDDINKREEVSAALADPTVTDRTISVPKVGDVAIPLAGNNVTYTAATASEGDEKKGLLSLKKFFPDASDTELEEASEQISALSRQTGALYGETHEVGNDNVVDGGQAEGAFDRNDMEVFGPLADADKAQRTLTATQGELSTAQDTITDQQQQIETMQPTIDGLTTRVQQLDADLLDARADVTKFSSQAAGLSAQVNSLTEQNNTLTAENTRLGTQISVAEAQTKAAEEMRDKAIADKNNAEQQAAAAQDNAQLAHQQARELRQKMADQIVGHQRHAEIGVQRAATKAQEAEQAALSQANAEIDPFAAADTEKPDMAAKYPTKQYKFVADIGLWYIEVPKFIAEVFGVKAPEN